MTIASLFADGEPLIGLDDINWGFSEGTEPYSQLVPFITDVAITLLRSQRSRASSSNPFFKLELKDDLQKSLTFHNVYIKGYRPHSDNYFAKLEFVDSRYFWNRGYFRQDYNIKARTGNKRVIRRAEQGTIGNLNMPLDTIDEFYYRTYSLRPSIIPKNSKEKQRVNTISDMLKDVFAAMNKYFKFNIVADFNGTIFGSVDKMLFENVSLDGTFKECIDNLMAYIPQIGLYLDNDGTVKFFDRFNDNLDFALINSMENEMEDMGAHVEYVTHELSCPAEIEVLFTVQTEVRLDFEEVGDQSQVGGGKVSRKLDNIVIVPDLEIKLAGGRTAFSGEYATFTELFNAWKQDSAGIKIDETKLRQYWVMGGMIRNWAKFGSESQPNVDWMARISALKTHYRQTFRINKPLMERIIHPEAFRVAIVDPTTKARMPSPIYMDYAVQTTERGRLSAGKGLIIENIKSFGGAGKNLVEARQCPFATASFSDIENGVFHISLQQDALGHYDPVYPSQVENAPTLDFSNKSAPRMMDEAAGGLRPALKQEHFMSIIITAVPTPNTGSELFGITYTPNDLTDSNLKARLGRPIGHKWQLRVPMSEITLMFPWEDSKAAAIEQLYGIGEQGKRPTLKELPTPLNLDLLQNIGLAKVSEFWAKFADRFKGGKVSRFQPSLRPAGACSEISHRMSTDSALLSSVEYGEETVSPDFNKFLSKEARRFIYSQVNADVKTG